MIKKLFCPVNKTGTKGVRGVSGLLMLFWEACHSKFAIAGIWKGDKLNLDEQIIILGGYQVTTTLL